MDIIRKKILPLPSIRKKLLPLPSIKKISLSSYPIKEDDIIEITNEPHLKLYNIDKNFYILLYIYNIFEFYQNNNNSLPDNYYNRNYFIQGLKQLYECLIKKNCDENLSFDKLDLIQDDISILPCGHFFYKKKIIEWFNYNISCPICRFDCENIQLFTISLTNIPHYFIKSIQVKAGENIKIKIKIKKYIKYLNKFDLKKLYNIATNKKIKFTLKTSKKQIINKLVKFKFP